jgi:thiol peroxidase
MMATVTLKGAAVNTCGDLPRIGARAPDFLLTDVALRDRTLAEYAGKKKLLYIFPSIDTSVCAASTRRFNELASSNNAVMLMISADLPFAHKRFCDAEELRNITTLSLMRTRKFAEDYGVLITDGPLAGVTARAVVVLAEDDRVLYTELVPEIAQHPDYNKASAALK